MRTIFIWDIHGCFKEFINLLEKLEYNKDIDKLYLTWDIINKWPESFKVLDFLIKNPQIKSVVWNNEINFLRYLKQDYINYNQTFNELKKYVSKKHIEYLKSLPTYIETSNWILLHAWVIPGKPLKEHNINEITRIRKINWKKWYEYYNKTNKKIIYWHYAADGLQVRKNTIWLDSGCVYWKYLTAYIYETWQVIQEPALKQYVKVTSCK